jgi:hypothetical protein
MEGPVTTPAVRRPDSQSASTQTCDADLNIQDLNIQDLNIHDLNIQDLNIQDIHDLNIQDESGMALFPARLHDLSLTAPEVAHYIFRRTQATESLRGANCLLRSAVNNTVTVLRIRLRGECKSMEPLQLASDLGATFPNAVELFADFNRASSAMELAHSLTGLPELCPTLLPRLQFMRLDLHADHAESGLCLSALNTLLSK